MQIPFALGASMVLFVVNLVYSLVFARIPAEQNPWHSKSIEWQLPSPVPVHNFDVIPTVVGGPYEYGVPGAVHGIFKPPAEAKPVSAGVTVGSSGQGSHT